MKQGTSSASGTDSRDIFETAYALWRKRRFPSGGDTEEAGDLRLDLLLIDEGLMDFVVPAVEGGRPYRIKPSAVGDLEATLHDLEGIRNRALEMRGRSSGEARIVVENVLEFNEIALDMYRGFLERVHADQSSFSGK